MGTLCNFFSTVRVEKVVSTNKQHQIFSCNNTEVSLCRNTHSDICIQLKPSKSNKKHIYILENFKSSTKFMKEGKVTLTLLKDQVLILLSNVPPANLNLFVKTLFVKRTLTNAQQQNNSFSSLDSGKSSTESNLVRMVVGKKSVQKISPLTSNELKKYDELRRLKSSSQNYNLTKNPQATNVNGGARNLSQENDLHASPTKFSNSSKRMKVDEYELNDEQKRVLKAILNRKNVFITGGAGTGKSYLMKCLITHLPPSSTFVTASTGIAASQINGTTINSFAGIGTGEYSLEKCIELASRKPYNEFWKRCQCLIIDEISMVSADYFSKLEMVARAMKHPNKPFGGIQLILCGDFYQLPPVDKTSNSRSPPKNNFCFNVDCWRDCVECCFELKVIHRQKNDEKFSRLLNYLRVGLCNDAMESLIKKTIFNNFPNGVVPTNLCTHKVEASSINQKHLDELSGEKKSYQSIDQPSDASSLLDSQTIVPANLNLKIGARVMLCCNLSVTSGLTNGSTGDVVRFDPATGYPVVYFNVAEKEVLIKPEKFTVKRNQNASCTRTQIPLALAWALSIHKSQGLTLDAVQVSLSKVFASGQTYVALSRAKSLKYLKVYGFSAGNLQVDPNVKDFYKNISFE